MTAPDAVCHLVDRFDLHRESYQAANYNETKLRREFVDPLFKALGWDIGNVSGKAEAYKDVVHEDSLKIGGTTKAPDYCFRIGGTRKFFVEAKKPAVNVKQDVNPAFQLRRYAWTAKLPLSILTDFEEFAVYDCLTHKPKKTDKASTARVMYLQYTDYADKWDAIESVFSRDAIEKGAFDKYAKTHQKKRGTAEVDDEFLKEIERWRSRLARNLALRNKELFERDLNFAVQRTIDRIIFLRICEDRGIERSGQLRSLANGPGIYPRLCHLFEKADDRYNSGLFHFHKETRRSDPPDELTLALNIDDKTLKEIIGDLYYPDCPYEFSVLPADILGQVYEQFLGKVIRLTKGHQARVEEKPEVKKAGGVYYTPTYIVDYIVKATVGKLVEGKSPEDIGGLTKTGKRSTTKRPLAVLDPACGSGSFLIGAYQYLLDWHLNWYVDDGAENWTRGKEPRLYDVPRDAPNTLNYRLTSSEKKRILLSHIYGVDIDPQAVEVTKLSLLLKVLEGENSETLQRQLFAKERALPDLAHNIKCGNSLIGPDYYEGTQQALFDEEELLRINAFDWKAEFPEIMQSGGFDAVIGNPPYIDSEWMTTWLKSTREYCVERFQAASGNWDMFCVFLERALSLCRRDGLASFIVPNKLGSAEYAAGARRVITRDNRLLSIRDYSHVPVFPVSVYPIVYVASRSTPVEKTATVVLQKMAASDTGDVAVSETHDLPYQKFFTTPAEPWQIFGSIGSSDLIEHLRQHPPLSQHVDVSGAATVAEAYEIKDLITDAAGLTGDELRLVNSGTIDRYHCLWGVKRCRYLGDSYLSPVIPADQQSRLPARRLKQGRSSKLIIAGMTRQLECIADLDGTILAGKSTTVVSGACDLLLLLAILNSRLISFYYSTVFGGNKLAGGYLRIGPPQLKTIPIPGEKPHQKAVRESLVRSVTSINELYVRMAAAKTGHERMALQRQITANDQQVDRLVYELYELTDEEIRIVDEATRP